MKEIVLADEAGVTLVDDDVYERIKNLEWKMVRTPDGKEYVRLDGEITLHRLVMGFPAGKDVDHINHDTRDNRKENLRETTRSQNQQNRKGLNRNNTTGVRGVRYRKDRRKYVATVKVDRVIRFRAQYDTLTEAEQAVLAARLELMTHSDGR